MSFEGDDLMLLDLRGNTKTGTKTDDFDFKPYVRDVGNPLCPVTAYLHYSSLDPMKESENEKKKVPLFRHQNGKSVSTKDVVKFLKKAVAAGDDAEQAHEGRGVVARCATLVGEGVMDRRAREEGGTWDWWDR